MPTIYAPFRDLQRDSPRAYCPRCGREQYRWDSLGIPCEDCCRRQKEREECTITLQEMSLEYRANAQIIGNRIQELKQARKESDSPTERDLLSRRLKTLGEIWRESRALASHMEHYYERGFRRNGRYTL